MRIIIPPERVVRVEFYSIAFSTKPEPGKYPIPYNNLKENKLHGCELTSVC